MTDSKNIGNFLLIIGAMKSGTTSLFKYLEDHPEIAGCRNKEPCYFTEKERWAKGWDHYTGLWDWDPSVHNVAMEASSNYTKMPLYDNAAEKIATIKDASFKFVYIIRNPVERIESHFNHGQVVGWDTTRDLKEDGLVDEQLIAVSRYARQIDEYYSRFPREDIKIILFDDLISRPAEIVREVCAFIGVDTNYESPQLGVAFNQNNVRIENKFIKKLRWSRTGRMLAPLFPTALRGQIKSLVGHKPKSKLKFSEQQRNYIIDLLKDDLVRLKRDYGIDTSCWGHGF